MGRKEGVGREGGICVIGFRGDGRHWSQMQKHIEGCAGFTNTIQHENIKTMSHPLTRLTLRRGPCSSCTVMFATLRVCVKPGFHSNARNARNASAQALRAMRAFEWKPGLTQPYQEFRVAGDVVDDVIVEVPVT